MNELFDKLTIRILITLIMCALLYVYRYVHALTHPSLHKQLTNKFFPSRNTSDTIHFFARIIGIALIFSELNADLTNGIWIALLDIVILSFFAFILFVLSNYIGESITLYNFEYNDEIHKRKNIAYALTSFTIVLSQALIIKQVLSIASSNIIQLLLVWMFSIVLYGFGAKSYKMVTKLSFNRLLIQKNSSVAFSFLGYILAITALITASIDHPLTDVKWYLIQSVLKILLAIIICPIFTKSIVLIYRISPSTEKELASTTEGTTIGDGIFEGILFLAVGLFTSAIITNINFSDFYPNF